MLCFVHGVKVKTQAEVRKTPVSEARKTPVTQSQTSGSSQFIPIHHPGAFPPLPSRAGAALPHTAFPQNTETHSHTHCPSVEFTVNHYEYMMTLIFSEIHNNPMHMCQLFLLIDAQG